MGLRVGSGGSRVLINIAQQPSELWNASRFSGSARLLYWTFLTWANLLLAPEAPEFKIQRHPSDETRRVWVSFRTR